MNEKNALIYAIVSLVLQIIGFSLIAMISWKIAIGLLIFTWGVNIESILKINREIEKRNNGNRNL